MVGFEDFQNEIRFHLYDGSDGFTSVFPDTPEAEREYNRIFA